MITHAPLGSAARAAELTAGAPCVKSCRGCGSVTAVTGPWDTYVKECDACPAPLVICDRAIYGRWLTVNKVDPVTRERMRLARRSFDRGLVGDFRPARKGGARRLLPLV